MHFSEVISAQRLSYEGLVDLQQRLLNDLLLAQVVLASFWACEDVSN